MKQLNKTHFYCRATKRYFSPSIINDHNFDYDEVGQCVEEGEDSSRDILFQIICDGFK